MRRNVIAGLLAGAALAWGVAADTVGQEPPKRKVEVRAGRTGVTVELEGPGGRVKVPRGRDRSAESGALAAGAAQRSSLIKGLPVKNAAGEEVGSVNDLVIDLNTGRVRYVAVSYGGFLGLGDKLFAVPWTAFERRFDRDEGSAFLVLNVDSEKLKTAPGFDQQAWPDFADPEFSRTIDQYYSAPQRATDRPRPQEGTQSELPAEP